MQFRVRRLRGYEQLMYVFVVLSYLDASSAERLFNAIFPDRDFVAYLEKYGRITRKGRMTIVDKKLHSLNDEPVCIDAVGTRWYKNGKRHRDGDKPAVIWEDGTQFWYKNGKLHRDGDKPAIICANGSRRWYKNGKRHRNGDKPAWIGANGGQYWYKNGKRHRNGDKPAVIAADGTQYWYKNGISINIRS